MVWLLLGMAIFVGVHSVSIVAPAWRDGTAARLGVGAWKGLYSVLSAVGLVLIVLGYAAARQQPVVLYTPPVWTRHLALLLMLPAFVLFVAAYLPGRIQRAARHPMLLSVKIWATAHLLANGTLADVILFGGLLAWAVADRISLKRRTPRPVPGAPPGGANDVIAVVLGLAIYAITLFWAHAALFGVSPLPGRS